jgi:hypothetical protein
MKGEVGELARTLLKAPPLPVRGGAQHQQVRGGGTLKKVLIAALAVWMAPGLALAEEADAPASPEQAPEVVSSEPAAVEPAMAAEPEVAAAPTATVVASPEEERKGGFSMGVTLDHSLGQGTFVDPAYFASFGGDLSFAPSYGFELAGYQLRASANASMGLEYTLPDSPTARRFNWSDLRLGISAPGLLKEAVTGITVSPNFGLMVPLTLESWRSSTITNLSLGVGADRKFGQFGVGYRFGVGKGVQASPAKVIPRSWATRRAEDGRLLEICRLDEEYCGTSGMNTAWSLSNSLSGSYRPTEKLSFSIGLGLSHAYKYAATDVVDEFTPQTVDMNGNLVARTGMGRADRMTGSLGVDYSLNDRFSLSGGIQTAQPPLTRGTDPAGADRWYLRFPFYDFVSYADSLTQYSVAVSATF